MDNYIYYKRANAVQEQVVLIYNSMDFFHIVRKIQGALPEGKRIKFMLNLTTTLCEMQSSFKILLDHEPHSVFKLLGFTGKETYVKTYDELKEDYVYRYVASEQLFGAYGMDHVSLEFK